MSELSHIEVENQKGKVVRRLRYRQLVTLQMSDESEPIRYIAMSWKRKDAEWARRHFAERERQHYTIVCYEDRRKIGRFRVHLCNTYQLKKKMGGGLYASIVMVAEDHVEKLQAFA